MLGAGELNRRATIERQREIPDGQGGSTRSWEGLGDVWVKATPIAGKEALINGTLRASQPWRIEMRPTDVTVKDRIKIGGATLGIQSVADPDGKRVSLVLFCDTDPS